MKSRIGVRIKREGAGYKFLMGKTYYVESLYYCPRLCGMTMFVPNEDGNSYKNCSTIFEVVSGESYFKHLYMKAIKSDMKIHA
jgi:hypothetical protein